MLDFIVSVVMTLFVTLAVPLVVICIFSKDNKTLSLKKIKIITAINIVFSLVVFFFIAAITQSKAPTAAPILIWSYVGYRIMKARCLPIEKSDNKNSEAESDNNAIEQEYSNDDLS